MTASGNSRTAAVTAKKPLRVLKFGGTSVGDAACIGRAVKIIRTALRDSDVVVVASAMAGVTNQLLEACSQAERGNRESVSAIFDSLRKQHQVAASALIASASRRRDLIHNIDELIAGGHRLCTDAVLHHRLTMRTQDAIASLGERLSARLVAAALSERGAPSEAVEATQLIVTNSNHGDAEPRMNPTRERCEAHLGPMLERGIVPVVTGFIGATEDCVLTTLGRGGSDYSATILGAVLGADGVVIWTDVDGILTADPRMVSNARTIAEVSYREATELAFFGAKVLHPKTLRPLMRSGIPVWIRNTFAPERPGTKITPSGGAENCGAKALAAKSDVSLITISGTADATDLVSRSLAVAAALHVEVLLLSRSSSQNDLALVVASCAAGRTVEALRNEFAPELGEAGTGYIALAPGVAILTVVGQGVRSARRTMSYTLGALLRADVDIVVQGASDCNISFLIARKDVRSALTSVHRELQLGKAKREAAFPKKALRRSTERAARANAPMHTGTRDVRRIA